PALCFTYSCASTRGCRGSMVARIFAIVLLMFGAIPALGHGHGSPPSRGVIVMSLAAAQAEETLPREAAAALPAPFEYVYLAPRSPGLQQIHQRVRDADLWRQLPELQAIDGMFLL